MSVKKMNQGYLSAKPLLEPTQEASLPAGRQGLVLHTWTIHFFSE